MRKNVLIVDDCDTTRKILSYMAKSVGYNPVTAVNGLDAIEKLAQNDISVIVTDLNMPMMDGLELVRTVRGNERYGAIPIIMVSTEAGENDRELGIKAGANLYMTKPITAKWLAYQIEKLA
ncbi:MAG: response regulator [Deltaproteobacteria bacterium]|nr:response regulator [Deltaproteobacteria bacterium]